MRQEVVWDTDLDKKARCLAAAALVTPAHVASARSKWASGLIARSPAQVPTDLVWPKPDERFWERPPATNRGTEPREVKKDSRTFHVIHIGAEARRRPQPLSVPCPLQPRVAHQRARSSTP